MADGDLALDDNGDLLFVNGDTVGLTGAEAIAADAKSRLLFFLGEDPLDLTGTGMPWIQTILAHKNPSISQIAQLVRQTLLNVPGALAVDTLDLEFDTTARMLTGGFQLDTEFGQTPYTPFGTPVPGPPGS